MPEPYRERVWIPGPRGRLAGDLAYGTGTPRGSALLLPPHPYMGGRMLLPLLSRLVESLAARDIVALRFDYGGVGESEGPRVRIGPAMQQFWTTGAAPEDPVFIEEAGAARGWLARHARGASAMIGYSFGSHVAAHLHDRGTAAMVMIAPTIARHDYSAFRNERTPTLIIYGDGDFATSDEELRAWAARLGGPTEVRYFPAGDHFFRGMEPELARAVADFLEPVCCQAEETFR